MNLTIRRIGNSLSIILPKATLESWGVGEGDSLALGSRDIRPPATAGLSHRALDELKRSIAIHDRTVSPLLWRTAERRCP